MATATETAREELEYRRRDAGRSTSAEPERITRTGETVPEHLELVNDEYARSILEALTTGPKRGRDLVEACEGSRATIYRRLNRLVEAGFVDEELTLDPDGHHCKEFHLLRDTLTVTVANGRLTVTVE